MTEIIGSKRKKMDEEKVKKIMSEWDQKSIDDFAAEFEVAPNTIRSMVYKIRNLFPDMCPKKPKKKREDIIRAAFEMLRAEETAEDAVTER